MFSLALVLVTIWIIDVLKVKMQEQPKILWYLSSWLIVAVMCVIAMLLALDYEHHAILMGIFSICFITQSLCQSCLHMLQCIPSVVTFRLWSDSYI